MCLLSISGSAWATAEVPCSDEVIQRSEEKKLSMNLILMLNKEGYEDLEKKMITATVKADGDFDENELNEKFDITVRSVITSNTSATIFTADLSMCDALRISADDDILSISGAERLQHSSRTRH